MEYNDALLAALIYSSLFSFPLTPQELQSRAIGKKVSKEELEKFLHTTRIKKDGGYYTLDGKYDMTYERQERKRVSEEKLRYGRGIIKHLSHIPSVEFIGVSGSVAVRNAVRSDDIDLFVVTASHTLWITRFFILLLLFLLGARRKNHQHMLCLNMLVDKRYVAMPVQRRDIYAAYELHQLEPVFDRRGTYQQLITQNAWTHQLLPNVVPKVPYATTAHMHPIFTLVLSWFDYPFSYIQKKHLENVHVRITQADGILAFHSTETRRKILSQFRQELKRHHLDKVIGVLYTRSDQ